jgi:perosamine synthetase
MPVHIYGQVGEVEEICAWAKDKGYFSVEDAAQALGCKKKGKSAGTFADIGVFSTYSDKILTTGEGSILTCKTQELADKIRLVRNQGRPNAGTFIHPSLGMNFRMTELQAALGLHQLNYIELELEERRAKYQYYLSKMKGLNGLTTMELISDSTLIPFRFPVLAENREKVQEALKVAGVQTRDFFVPMHMQPQFINNQVKELPNATMISKMGLCLPVHHSIKNEDIDLMFKAMT